MSLAETLKKAREAKGLTLRDISSKTRISEKYLEKIENGVYDFAPKPYVRAFLRSYARTVGLNPDEIIKQYESEIISSKPKEEKKEEKKVLQFDVSSFIMENALWLIGGLIVIAIVVLIFFGINEEESSRKQIQRKTFESAVEEISKSIQTEPVKDRSEPDSLVLKVISTDSVWFSVIVDSLNVKEFLLPPNMSLTLKAKNSFNFTIGNAGGVKFILNGYELESAGKKGAVVRNYIIDRKKLELLSSQQ